MTTYCPDCTDSGWLIWRDKKNRTWAKLCHHVTSTQVPFNFPKGTWAYTTENNMPTHLQTIVKNYPEPTTVLLTGRTKHATAAARLIANQLKQARPRYIDAMTAPQEFSEPTINWINLYNTNNLLIIDSIDRRLRAPQIRAVVDLIHIKPRPVILIGDPPALHPQNEPWLALAIELQRRETKLVKI
jgi:hypothetical protein